MLLGSVDKVVPELNDEVVVASENAHLKIQDAAWVFANQSLSVQSPFLNSGWDGSTRAPRSYKIPDGGAELFEVFNGPDPNGFVFFQKIHPEGSVKLKGAT